MKDASKYTIEELLEMVEEKVKEETMDKIVSAKEAYISLIEYATKEVEHFMVITLDGASNMIRKELVFKGTLNQSLVHPREVFRLALQDNAAGIIIAHNHPSGTLEPSRADIQITKRLVECGKLLGIEVLDHIILSHKGYYSFSDEGML